MPSVPKLTKPSTLKPSSTPKSTVKVNSLADIGKISGTILGNAQVVSVKK